MKPWVFWTGQVPEITGYDQYAQPVEEQPRRLTKVRIVVVEAHKYVIEVEGQPDALGGIGWYDIHDFANVDPAMILESCLLDVIARRQALGLIWREDMPPEPKDDEPALEIEKKAPHLPLKERRRKATELLIEGKGDRETARATGITKETAARIRERLNMPAKSAGYRSKEPEVVVGEKDDDAIDAVGEERYRARCREKFAAECVADEIRLNNARGRIISVFSEVGVSSFSSSEIARMASCSGPTVSNYCKDYAAAGWLNYKDGKWTLLRELPVVAEREKRPDPAWMSRKDVSASPAPAVAAVPSASSNGHASVSASAPLIDRVVDTLSRGPQKFDRLAGLLVVGVKPLSDALANLMADGTVMMQNGCYQLDEGV